MLKKYTAGQDICPIAEVQVEPRPYHYGNGWSGHSQGKM
jgi:hypothetical protein